MSTFAMPSFRSAFNAARSPIIGLIILEIAWYILERTPLSFLAGDWLYLVKFALFFWAGWQAVRLALTRYGALLAGALAGLAVQIADFILSNIFYPGDHSFLFWIEDFILWIIIGAITAGIGHFIATSRKKPTPTA